MIATSFFLSYRSCSTRSSKILIFYTDKMYKVSYKVEIVKRFTYPQRLLQIFFHSFIILLLVKNVI